MLTASSLRLFLGSFLIAAIAAGQALAGSPCVPPEELFRGDHRLAACHARFHGEEGQARGLDVSKWQDEIDWAAVDGTGMLFAFIRISHGHTPDKDFAKHWADSHATCLMRGGYHFFEVAVAVEDQFHAIVTALEGKAPAELPIVLDVEAGSAKAPLDSAAAIDDFVRKVARLDRLLTEHFGTRPIIYASPSFWKRLGHPSEFPDGGMSFAEAPLWLAEYGTSHARVPHPWTEYTFWQTGQETVAGIDGQVDANIFNGPPCALPRLAIAAE